MNVPLQISFRNVRHKATIEELIIEKVKKLDRYRIHISHCRVVVEKITKHRQLGNPYIVKLNIGITPRHEITIRREPKKGQRQFPLDSIIREIFTAAYRQINKTIVYRQELTKRNFRQKLITREPEIP